MRRGVTHNRVKRAGEVHQLVPLDPEHYRYVHHLDCRIEKLLLVGQPAGDGHPVDEELDL
jgi:hypothetical protein